MVLLMALVNSGSEIYFMTPLSRKKKCRTPVFRSILRTVYIFHLETLVSVLWEKCDLQSTPPIEENSWRHRRLRSELKTLKSDPPEGIRAEPLDRHCCHWQASITGPQGSPYEGGLFLLYLQIPDRSVTNVIIFFPFQRSFHGNRLTQRI